MKKIVFIFFAIFTSFWAQSQCCPYIDSVIVIPESPVEGDEIKIIATVTTPNLGAYLGSEVEISGSDVTVEACYYSGMLTALQTYVDTTSLGYLDAGTYTLDFIANQSDNDEVCNIVNTNSIEKEFTVTGGTSGISPAPENSVFTIYPNPATDFIRIKGLSETANYTLINVVGEEVMRGTTNSQEIDIRRLVPGVYFIVVQTGDIKKTHKLIIR